MCQRAWWSLGLPPTRKRDCFHPRLFVVAHRPSPEFNPRLILPWSGSPSEFLLFNHHSTPFGSSGPHQGFGPLGDITKAQQLARGFPGPRYVPTSGFLSLPPVYSALRLASLFHPAATSRTSCSGASPSTRPSFLIGKRLPPCRWAKLAFQP